MNYSILLKSKIQESGWSYAEVSRRCKLLGVKMDKVRLSKLCSGKLPPAANKTNNALAEVLSLVTDISVHQLDVAAYKQKIPPDILNALISEGVKEATHVERG